jgi:hypothetical protein
MFFVYHETIRRDLKKRLIYVCRCDEILKAKDVRVTHLTSTVLSGGLEHRKITTRLIDEKFVSVMGECVFVKLWVNRLYLELYVKLPPWEGF